MQFSPHKRRRAPSVIIVSLIDVLLVVLIFLMVSSTFKKNQHSLRLTLPESKQAKAGPTETKPFMVLIASNTPYLYLEGQPITLDSLQNVMETAAKKDPQLKVTIKADKHAPLGEYVRVIDAATAAKVAGITLQTEKPSR
jgi:biopolymer transport protein ExbD